MSLEGGSLLEGVPPSLLLCSISKNGKRALGGDKSRGGASGGVVRPNETPKDRGRWYSARSGLEELKVCGANRLVGDGQERWADS